MLMNRDTLKYTQIIVQSRCFWIALVVISIGLLARDKLAIITADLLYLTAKRMTTATEWQVTPATLLRYAKWLVPNATFVSNQEGVLQAQLGMQINAASAFEQALQVNQSDGPALNNLAVANYQQKLLQEATQLQKRATIAEPNQAIIWYNLGLLLTKQSKLADAARAFLEATRINAMWELPYIQLGATYLALHNETAAEYNARRALALNLRQKSAHLILIAALANQCKLREGLQASDQALNLYPRDEELGLRKALLLRELGDEAAARKVLEPIFLASTNHQIHLRVVIELQAIVQSSQQNSVKPAAPVKADPHCQT